MRTLVIPDIHQNWRFAQRAVDLVQPDKLVCLGDYFDSDFREYAENGIATLEWISAMRERFGDSATFLIGNHDLQYLYPSNRGLQCPGCQTDLLRLFHFNPPPIYTEWKSRARWFHGAEGILFSHAGVNPAHVPEGLDLLGLMLYLDPLEQVANQWCEAGRSDHWFCSIGRARGGIEDVGGLIWQDWHAEHAPLSGIPQVVGHTWLSKPVRRDVDLNLDAVQKYVGVLEQGRVRVLQIPD